MYAMSASKHKHPQQGGKMKRSKVYMESMKVLKPQAVGPSPILVQSSVLHQTKGFGGDIFTVIAGASLVSYTSVAFIIKILPFSPSSILPFAFLLALSRSAAVYQRQHWILPFQHDQQRVYPP